MCGIYGHYLFNENEEISVEKIIEKLHHRGPDSTGILKKGPLCLAHKRLAIIDLSKNGNQPLVYENLSIIFNGEIYNHNVLREKLKKANYFFDGRSDTEVLLKAFHKWGPSSIKLLEGMFAFAIFDSKNKKIILSRDLAGEKPIYYYLSKNKFAFASELKSIKITNKILDYKAISFYLSYGYFPRADTVFKSVKKIIPGTYLEFDLENKRIKSFKYLEEKLFNEKKKYKKEVNIYTHEKNIENLLIDSVKNKLQADVKVAVLLSGGIDSGLVTAFAKKIKPDIQAYTVKFDNQIFDESVEASKIAEHLKVKHKIIRVQPPNFEELKELLSKVDEPFADSSIIPTAILCKNVSQEYKVALSGDGGDELFGGYTHYKWCRRQILLRKIFPRKLLNFISNNALKKIESGQRGYNFLSGLKGDIKFAFANANKFLNSEEINNILKINQYQNNLDYALDYKIKLFEKFKDKDILRSIMKVDFLTYLPDDILFKTDRSSMLSSLELRSPFLDQKVIKYAYSNIASIESVNIKQTKKILRSIAYKYLPKSIVNLRKKGFSIPIDSWMKDYWYEDLKEYFLNSKSLFLNKKNIKKIFYKWDNDNIGSNNIFLILNLLIWEENNL